MADRGPFCVGIDPHAQLLLDWGLTDDVAGLETFALTVVEAVAPYVSVVKPQSAFYERFGSRGIAVLERVVSESRAAGALVLLDVKRGDIGSTSQAYADAYLDQSSPLAVDAITASPFLGFGSIAPMIDTARKHDAGVFVLALTSNKEGAEVQACDRRRNHRRRPDDRAPPRAQRGRGAARLVRGRRRGDHPGYRSRPRLQRPGPGARDTAPRAARRPTSPGSSGRPPGTCSPAPRARCCGSDRTGPRCVTRSRRANDELRGLAG